MATAAAALVALLVVGMIAAANPPLTFVEVQRDGVGGVDGLGGAYSVTVSPDGKHVYVGGIDDDAVAVFTRNSTSGALTFATASKDGVDGLDGVTSVRVSPDGKHVYASSEIDDAVAVFTRNSTTGALTFTTTSKDGVGGVDGLNGVISVMVSPDGQHLYTAAGVASAVAVFSRNSGTGALSFVEVHEDNVLGVDGLGFAWSVTLSPDGQHVYVTGLSDNALAVFSRNSTTGALSFVEFHQDGVSGVDGLSLATGISVSPDGKHVYGTGRSDNAVAVFSGQPAANLSIAKSANPSPVAAGFNLTYTLTVTNGGPDAASGVVVTDTLPGTVTFVSASSGCSELDGEVTCTAASLANGASVEFTITITAPGAVGPISNTVSVTSTVADINPTNNTAVLVTTIVTPESVPGLTTWGLAALALALVALAFVTRRRRNDATRQGVRA